MKFVKLFIISVVVLFGLLTAFSALLPSKVRISRAIDINDSRENVMAKIRDMKQWDQWNEYTRDLAGKRATTDSIQADLVSVSVISADSASVTANWRQHNKKPFPSTFNLSSGTAHTTVQWYFEFSIRWYPWEKFGSIVYDKELGPQMEKSLQNLKQMLEKAP